MAQGYTQKKNVHYNEVFSPTVKTETVRLALALAASRNYVVNHFDITTAYLNAELQEKMYMAQAPGFESSKPGMMYKLNKAIYGLQQSVRNWYQCLHLALEKLKYRNSLADPCLYVKEHGK